MGHKVKALDDRPIIMAEYIWLWTAYNRLATTRQLTGHGVGPIDWDSTVKYARDTGMNTDERDFLWDVVQRLDSKFLAVMRARLKQPSKPNR